VDGLLGRAAECAQLDLLLATARRGRSAALVVRGEPGLGKTALLDYLAATAADFEVVRVDGVQSEMELSFAALHQVLLPVLADIDTLPPPQRTALRLAFGLQDGGPPDLFLVGLAALELLAARAARRPLLLVADDAHWLDQESARALAFIARRLYADSLAMVFAVREPAPEPAPTPAPGVLAGVLASLPELRLAGLGESSAGELLATAAGPRLDRSVRERIVAEVAGNPLALIEIGQGLAPGQLSGESPLPQPVPLGRQLEQRYLQEIRGLPAATQTLLLTAAADPAGDRALLWRAGRELGFTADSAAPAEARQLITIRESVRFRHPLIRSAVYYGAPLAQRQRVHAALAAAIAAGQRAAAGQPSTGQGSAAAGQPSAGQPIAAGQPSARQPIAAGQPSAGQPIAAGQPSVADEASVADAPAGPASGELDRLAWHQAQAASGPDEAVAGDLERAGERARQRGGWTAAQALFWHAATLSAEPRGRARRLLSAAEASLSAGVSGRAQSLLDEAAAVPGAHHQGLVQRLQGRIYHIEGRPAEATAALLAAATELGPVDIRLARDTLVEAIVQAQINDQLAPEGTTRADVARVARTLPLPPGSPATPGDLLLDADTTLQLNGLVLAAAPLRRAIDAVRSETAQTPETFQWLAAACADATILGDDAALHELASRMEPRARQQGAVLALSLALSHAGVAELLAGLLPEAERCFVERAAIEEARGHDWSIGALLISAWRGQASRARALLDVVSTEAARQGQGYQLVFAGYARCILELGLGQYQRAYDGLTAGIADTSQLKFALADLVEAAERSGQQDAARRLTGRLERLAAASPVPATLGSLARARALVARDDPGAEEQYQAALRHHGQTRGPAHLARSQLVYGEWLRRARRPREAREQLRAARGRFAGMGAAGFAARARRELAAAGEPTHAQAAAAHHDLTPQETRVARLAASGATNAEIAAQLFLSANTIDYHLRKVFRKLGVTSRRQLVSANLESAI
jgi:DNA-binding CsgD family transcriptional regulator